MGEIAPVAVTDDDVTARDIAAGIVKSFKLAHVELAWPDNYAPPYDSRPAGADTRTIGAALEPHVAGLRALVCGR